MKKFSSPDSASDGDAGRRSRLPWHLAAGCLLALLIALLWSRKDRSPTADPALVDAAGPATTANSSSAGFARRSQRLAGSDPAAPAGEIVTNKVHQFSRSRREIVHAIASKLKVEVPAEVERFFDAIEAGRWEEVEPLAKALRDNLARSGELAKLWPPIHEAWGAIQETSNWPAQKLLDYGEAVLGSLRPGMIYVGGTDSGRWIPTLLNETSEGEHHVILTQNAFADSTYVDYINFLYSDRLATLTKDDSGRAFSDYIADAHKRLQHDQQFPDEPKQIRPDEDVRSTDGRVQVSGQVAVMAINERLLQALMEKNPDASFALEESYSFKNAYANATPLGPIMELRVQDEQSALTAERAAQSLDYWRNTAQQLLSDPETPDTSDARKAYSHMAMAQANLFAEHNYSAEAEQAYRVASELSPSYFEPVDQLSKLLLRTGRADEARQLRDNFARNHPDQRPEVDASGTFNVAVPRTQPSRP